MSQAALEVDALDYYLPEPLELQAALRPILALHPEYDARELRAIIKGARSCSAADLLHIDARSPQRRVLPGL
jgi:hypothetical protein